MRLAEDRIAYLTIQSMQADGAAARAGQQPELDNRPVPDNGPVPDNKPVLDNRPVPNNGPGEVLVHVGELAAPLPDKAAGLAENTWAAGESAIDMIVCRTGQDFHGALWLRL